MQVKGSTQPKSKKDPLLVYAYHRELRSFPWLTGQNRELWTSRIAASGMSSLRTYDALALFSVFPYYLGGLILEEARMSSTDKSRPQRIDRMNGIPLKCVGARQGSISY